MVMSKLKDQGVKPLQFYAFFSLLFDLGGQWLKVEFPPTQQEWCSCVFVDTRQNEGPLFPGVGPSRPFSKTF